MVEVAILITIVAITIVRVEMVAVAVVKVVCMQQTVRHGHAQRHEHSHIQRANSKPWPYACNEGGVNTRQALHDVPYKYVCAQSSCKAHTRV